MLNRRLISQLLLCLGVFVAPLAFAEPQIRHDKDGLRGAINDNGKLIVPYRYMGLSYDSDKKRFLATLRVSEQTVRMGILDEQGNAVVPVIYEDLRRISNSGDEDTHLAQLNGKWGYVNIITGEVLIKPVYDGLIIESLMTDAKGMGIAVAAKEDKWGVLNTRGETLVSFDFDDVVATSADEVQMRRGKSIVKLRFDGQRFIGETPVCSACGGQGDSAFLKAVQKGSETAFGGIGVALGEEFSFMPGIFLVDVLVGGPADKSGLQVGDKLQGIDDVSIEAMSIEDVRQKLRGEAGSKVKLQVLRDDAIRQFSVTREVIQLK